MRTESVRAAVRRICQTRTTLERPDPSRPVAACRRRSEDVPVASSCPAADSRSFAVRPRSRRRFAPRASGVSLRARPSTQRASGRRRPLPPLQAQTSATASNRRAHEQARTRSAAEDHAVDLRKRGLPSFERCPTRAELGICADASRRAITVVGCHAGGEVGNVDRRRRAAAGGRDRVRADADAARRRLAAPPAAPRAARVGRRARQPDRAADARRLRRRLHHHGADRVPGDVGLEHDLRRHGAARDRDGRAARARDDAPPRGARRRRRGARGVRDGRSRASS